MEFRGGAKKKVSKKRGGRGGGEGLALIYLTEDNDSGEACVRMIWNGWMENEDSYLVGKSILPRKPP